MSEYTLKLSEAEIARYRFMAEQARTSEADLWATAGIQAGSRIADIGCGPGAVTVLLAEAVGPEGEVVGVDADEEALAAARGYIATTGLGNATVRAGQADATGLPAGSYDVIVLRHVLSHNGGSEQRIVDHLASLARPGGSVYLVDVDLAAIRMFPAPAGMEDMLDRYAAFHRQRGNDASVGIRLQQLGRSAGLEVVTYRGWFEIADIPRGLRPPAWAARDAMVTAGVIDEADVARWGEAMDRLDAEAERPLIFTPLFAAVCRRPGSSRPEAS